MIVCLLVCVIACGCARRRVGIVQEVDGGQQGAAMLIDALGAYHREHGEYPERLQILLTAYLPRLPRTPAGLSYRYSPSDLEGGYSLCFDLTNNPRTSCCYSPRLGSWDCSMKATD